MTDARKVAIESVRLDERCQARAQIDHEAIEEYAAAYGAKAALPPLEVYDVDGELVLVDGFHRLPAALKAGVRFLRVTVVGEGTIEEAAWYATSVNRHHGVRRSNADKRRAVELALRSPIGAEQSSRVIADHIGVSPDFVARMRAEIEGSPAKVRGRDGKSYDARKVSSDDTHYAAPELSSEDSSELPPSRPEPADEQPLPHEPEHSSVCPHCRGTGRRVA